MSLVPPVLDILENVTYGSQRAALASFFSGPAARFKIYIDSACELPASPAWEETWAAPKQWGVTGNQHWATKYGAQGFIPKMIKSSPFVTAQWQSASVSLVVLFARHFGGGPAIVQQQCLQRLRQRSEAWRATNGSRHFFIFTDSRGPCCLDGKYKDVDFLRHHIIGPHGEPSAADQWFFRRGSGPRIRCFDERKDINIPTPNVHFPRTPFAPPLPEPPSPAPARSLLLFYAGWNYGTRMELVRMYEADAEVVVRRRVKKADYADHMWRARFCPICGGFSQWTPRLAEALYYGCVPVLLSPMMLPPWSNLLDWSTFSVTISPTHKNLAQLKATLKALNYARLWRGVRAAKHALTYHLGGYTGTDMLPLLLYEMWRVSRAPLRAPDAVRTISNDVDPERDYNAGLQDVRSQRKAHSVETHAVVSVSGSVWDCASMDGYMCECRRRDHPGDASRARRCFVSAACYPGRSTGNSGLTPSKRESRRSRHSAAGRQLAELQPPAVSGATPAVKDAAAQAGHEPHRSPCQDSSKKAKNRRATCRSPTVAHARARGRGRPSDVLWSRQSLQRRSQFVNEEPFNASRAFSRYWAQLPESGSLGGSRDGRHRMWSVCDGHTCPSCAAVGASGTLLSHEHGGLIDNHSVVLRANWLKLEGYSRHVGSRTTLNVIFALENMLDQFVRSQRRLPAARRAIGLATPSSKRSLNSYLRYLGRLKTNVSHALHRPRAGDAPLYLLSDEMWAEATAQLCLATEDGCAWYSRSSTMRPSSGFYAVLVALRICKDVSLFGLTSEPCAPFHYYGPKKAACTLAVPKENDEHVHWFEKEHEIYARWQQEGRLRIYS